MERIVPDLISEDAIGYETVQLHLDRYAYASKFLSPEGAVMDLACGVGYGSYYLAQHSSSSDKIIVIDIDEASIAYAQSKYRHHKIEFLVGDALTVSSVKDVQTVVSLETIEHLDDPTRFVHHIAAQLQKGNRFIASVPITPSMDANPFHLHDFTKNRFRSLLQNAGFREIDHFIQIQHFKPRKVLERKAGGTEHLRKNILAYYTQHPQKFFLRIAATFRHGFTNKYFVGVFEKV